MVLVSILITNTHAQISTAIGKPLDSLRYYTNKDNGGFRLGFDGRQSYIAGRSAAVAGIRYGLNYGKIACYAGYYSSSMLRASAADTQTINLNYVAYTTEYYLKEKWRYDLYIPVAIGYGVKQEYFKTSAGELSYNNAYFIPAEIGIGGTVRFLRYFGLAASTGYRLGLINGKNFTAPYYSIGLTYYTGTMWKDTKRAYKKVF